MDVFSEIVRPVIQVLMGPVKKQLGYMISCTTYVRNMHTKMRQLDIARRGEEDHLNVNTTSHLEISSQVTGWLDEVEKTKAEVENFPDDIGSCFNLRVRHKLGRKAFKMIEEIDSAILSHSLITWTNTPIPLGRVNSMKASTSTPPSTTDHHQHEDFPSREKTFTAALEALGPNQKPHMIALSGMGGVGKTTMMQRLKKVVKEKKMYKFIVEAVIGEKTDPISIQEAVASYLGIELKEKNKPARADKLRERFEANSNGGTNKFLIILDDVWQPVDLEDIGLSPLPNQGVDFKILLTSRDKHVCSMMGVEASSIINVGLLKESEAHSLFHQFVQVSDPERHQIGEEIVKKCCGLPIAIKTMACTLRNKRMDAWKDALSRLEHHNIDNVSPKVFETSYDNLDDEETKSVFMLCGLFPEDFDIPTKELLTYGWGLKIFKRVSNIRQARYRVNTCIERLVDTNLLLEDDGKCVKLHDLVRAFVLDMFSKVEHASIVNHGSKSGWPEYDMRTNNSCQRISLTCSGMSEFPSDLKFPNLLMLKLMYGNKYTLRFPHNFYQEMEKLKVISYHQMGNRFLPSSLDECAANLRVLHLHECSLEFDGGSSIGNLLNLEVLSLVNCYPISRLPASIIGNLKKLRSLDVTNCGGLCIDNGVFKDLVQLEEFYALYDSSYQRPIRFTGDNCNQVAERWKNLSALEFEFLEDNAQWKNLSFDNLERFMISVGRPLEADDFKKSKHSFENMLKLVIKKDEVLGSKINKLFEKTNVLCLSVNDMNDIEDVGVKSSFHPDQPSNSFGNLRILVVSECTQLTYGFTVGVAKVLSNLEHLQVFNCRLMKELIHAADRGIETITIFPKLKFLSLSKLPELLSLCLNVVKIIALPQLVELTIKHIPNITSIFSKTKLATSCCLLAEDQVVIPKLENLWIEGMYDLEEIWPLKFTTSKQEIKLREIQVHRCSKLMNLFPCNPMALLHHLEAVQVEKCGSVEVLFNIDLDCVGETGDSNNWSSLRSITVYQLDALLEVWRIKGANQSPRLPIRGFQAVKIITIRKCQWLRNVFSPTTTMLDLGALIDMRLYNSRSVRGKYKIAEDWRGKEIQQQLESPFHNLTTIKLEYCESLDYLFSPLIAKLLSNLKEIKIENCNAIMDVVSDRDDHIHYENTTSTQIITTNILFPHLDTLTLKCLLNLRRIGGGAPKHKFSGADGVFWSLSKYPTKLSIKECNSLSHVIPCYAAEQINNVQVLEIQFCPAMKEVFETQRINQSVIAMKLANLKILRIIDCNVLEHIFTFSTLETLGQLEELRVDRCKAMKVIVVKEEQDGGEKRKTPSEVVHVVVFPRLKSLILADLPELVGFFLGTNIEFHWPSLDSVYIDGCLKMKVFTAGRSTAPQLKNVQTGLGLHSRGCWFNSHVITTTTGQQVESKVSSFRAAGSEGINPWSFHNLIELDVRIDTSIFKKRVVFPSNVLLHLQKLEKISLDGYGRIDEMFEELDRKNSGFDESITVIKLPSLREMYLGLLYSLKYMWKSNQWTLFEFPSLTTVSITRCDSLQHVFTSSMVGSLKQLQHLSITWCYQIEEVIVKDANVVVEDEDGEEESDGKMVEILLPRLKSLKLDNIPCLKGFYLGTEDFSFPLLGTLTIKHCPEITTFTTGNSSTPVLKEIETGFGSFSGEKDINSLIKMKKKKFETDKWPR